MIKFFEFIRNYCLVLIGLTYYLTRDIMIKKTFVSTSLYIIGLLLGLLTIKIYKTLKKRKVLLLEEEIKYKNIEIEKLKCLLEISHEHN